MKTATKFRFQFSLKSLMIFVTAVAVVMGIWRSFRETTFLEEFGNIKGKATLSLKRLHEAERFLEVKFEGFSLGGGCSQGTKSVSLFGNYGKCHEYGSGDDDSYVLDSETGGGVLKYDISITSISKRINISIYDEGSSVECNGKKFYIPPEKKLEIDVHPNGKFESYLSDTKAISSK